MARLSRELTSEEQRVLDFLLACDFPGAPELREQAKVATVTGRCACGCPTIDLTVDRSKAPRASIEPRVPVEATMKDGSGFVLLFVDDGWLQALEIAWVTDERLEAFPPIEFFAPRKSGTT
jgi:hypothetical protein